MGKYGSGTVWFLADGYDMVVNKLQALRYKIEATTEPTHGLGDAWEEHTPTGTSRAELAQEGAFFDNTAGYMHNLQSTTIAGQSPSSTPKVVCIGVEGQTTGADFVGIEGTFQAGYEVLATKGNLDRANAEYMVTGAAEHGKIVRALAATTGDTTQYLDSGAASALGGASYFQVTAISLGASTGVALSMLESAATSTAYTTLGTVTTTGIGAWRVATTDTAVERYLSATVDFSSAATSDGPSVECFIGFARI